MKRVFCIIVGLAMDCPAFAGVDSAHSPWTIGNIYDGAKALKSYSPGANLSEDDRTKVTFAYGWLMGSASSLEAAGLMRPDSKYICITQPPSAVDLASAYVAYVDAHPKSLPADAGDVLIAALRQEHPCK